MVYGDDKREDGFSVLAGWIAGFPSWLAGLYRKRGFTPFALGLICIGVILGIVFFSMEVPKPWEPLTGWVAIRAIWQWSLIIGVGYFLYRLFLTVVSKTAEAAKTGVAKAPPPAPATTPPDTLKTRLRNLEDLHNDGLLTDAEYQAKREEILGEV